MDESNSIDDPLDLFMRQQDEAISVTTQDTAPEKYRTKAGIEEPLAVIPPQVALQWHICLLSKNRLTLNLSTLNSKA